MLKNYLKTAFRNLLHHKTYTFIKIAGLALALAASIAIFSWVKYELSYDNFHQHGEDIYRLVPEDGLVSAPPGFKQLFAGIPEIESTVRIFKAGFLGEKTKVARNDIIYTNDEIYYADEDFFSLFTFPIVSGNSADFTEKPNAAVISEATAAKYFGNEDPVGKTLLLADSKEIEITGVMKNIPANSHFHFDILLTIKSFPWQFQPLEFGSAWIFATYIKIHQQTSIKTVQQKATEAYAALANQPDFHLSFQPLRDIHLRSAMHGELEANGDIKYVYLFSAIGLLIIIIAGINYINLTTALSASRAKEIGIRKAIGAAKQQLTLQIMGESLLISAVAFLVALLALEILLPLFTSLVGISFSASLNDPFVLGSAMAFTLIIGAVTGLFPALVLAKFDITTSIKSGILATDRKSGVRGLLVIFQFCISVILIFGTLVIYQQMRYVHQKKLGYNKEQVLVLHCGFETIAGKIDLLKKMIGQNPDVAGMTACSQLPTNIITQEGVNTRDGKRYEAHYISVDKHFFDTMQINVIKGQEEIAAIIPEENPDWRTIQNRFVVNQALLKSIAVDPDDIGEHTLVIRHGNMQPGPIIGVVEDFHFKSLHTPIQPLVFEFTAGRIEYLLVRIQSDNIPSTIKFVEQQWQSLAGGLPFEYHFLDEHYDALYKAERHVGHLAVIFTLISIFIIVLGLLGLVSFITTRKTKEIGIRKVLGASIGSVLFMLSKTFVRWTLIANLIAWPIAWYAMNKWLQNFAYRIHIEWWMFALAGALALAIALLTVSWQALRAAVANPVESLRYE